MRKWATMQQQQFHSFGFLGHGRGDWDERLCPRVETPFSNRVTTRLEKPDFLSLQFTDIPLISRFYSRFSCT